MTKANDTAFWSLATSGTLSHCQLWAKQPIFTTTKCAHTDASLMTVAVLFSLLSSACDKTVKIETSDCMRVIACIHLSDNV